MKKKIRFVGAQTLNFHGFGCMLCMASIANIHNRLLTMLGVIGKYKHVGKLYEIFNKFMWYGLSGYQQSYIQIIMQTSGFDFGWDP